MVIAAYAASSIANPHHAGGGPIRVDRAPIRDPGVGFGVHGVITF
jgi:hypothetical protein